MIQPWRDEDVLPLSLVAHTSFCPRRAWSEACGEHVESAQMQEGTSAHRRVDNPRRSGRGEARAVDVNHAELGLVGKCDVVADTDEGVSLIEYKATPVRLSPTVTEAMRTQLALQKLCLTASGHRVSGVSVFFTTHHRYVEVALDEDDERRALRLVEQTRKVVSSTTAPPPLEDSPRCGRCSHVGICLPDERRYLSPARRIVVADPDSQVVHLATPGSRASLSKGRMVVSKNHERLVSVPLQRVQGLVVHGNIDLSSALIRELMWRDLSVVWCSGTGRVYGWARSSHAANGAARVRQYVVSDRGDIALAREFVTTKIANQAVLLRRNGTAPEVVVELRRMQRLAGEAPTVEAILGVEGGGCLRLLRSISNDAQAVCALRFRSRVARSLRKSGGRSPERGAELCVLPRHCGGDPGAHGLRPRPTCRVPPQFGPEQASPSFGPHGGVPCPHRGLCRDQSRQQR